MQLRVAKFVHRMLPNRVKIRLSPYYRRAFTNITHVVFNPTFGCNYRCPYCSVFSREYRYYPRESEHSWEEWVEAFDRFPPALINISGGEPFYYRDLVQLIANMPPKHTIIGISTNLSLPFNELADISSKNFTITASFHPHMTDKEPFAARVLKVKEYGIRVKVEVVAYPGILPHIPELKAYFEKELKVAFTADPDVDPSRRYSEEEARLIKEYMKKGIIISGIRRAGYEFDDYSLKQCKAGSKYFAIMPNGDVYTCMAGFSFYTVEPYNKLNITNEEFRLGNLFDGSFKPLSQLKICSLPCSGACDLQLADVKPYKPKSR